jgi:hypothetical protein
MQTCSGKSLAFPSRPTRLIRSNVQNCIPLDDIGSKYLLGIMKKSSQKVVESETTPPGANMLIPDKKFPKKIFHDRMVSVYKGNGIGDEEERENEK